MDPARAGAPILPISDARSTPRPKRRHQTIKALQIAGLRRRGGRLVADSRVLGSAPGTGAARFGSIPLLLREGRDGLEPSKLAGPNCGTLGLVHARDPALRLCGSAFPASRALPPHPLQRLGERLAAEALPLLRNEFADGKVRLLLAGARSAEGHAQDLHLRSTGARALRPTSHLARAMLRLGQGTSDTRGLRSLL